MKKTFVRIATFLMLVCLFPVQLVQACSGFIIGKGLTTDGSILYGRTEDYPYPPNNGAHNKNYIVVPATAYAKGICWWMNHSVSQHHTWQMSSSTPLRLMRHVGMGQTVILVRMDLMKRCVHDCYCYSYSK